MVECMITQELTLCLQIDDKTIYSFCGKVNEEALVKYTKDIEQLLKEHGAKPSKIRNVFELVVETLQNMIHYSACTVENEDGKKESPCSFTLSYHSEDESYIIDSCNLIESYKKDIIQKRLKEVQNLTKPELRKLTFKKVRSQHDRHSDGAGLGFIMMARKSKKPIEIEFIPSENNLLKFRQRLVV